MKTLTSRPLASWIVWAGGLLTVFLILTRQFIYTGVTTDKSGISLVIIVLFGIGFFQSYRAAMGLHREWQSFRRIKADKKLPAVDGKDGLGDLFARVAELRTNGIKVDLDNFMSLYYARHDSHAQTVATFGALLITMGLLGTVVGLIVAIQGLGGMIENMSVSRVDMLASLRLTIQGMGTAFYTTFFGALLGGIILRILSANLMNALTELAAEAMEFCELYILPGAGDKESEMWTAMAAEWKARLAAITESFSGMVRRVDVLSEQLGEAVGGLVDQVNSAGAEIHKVRAHQLGVETKKVASQLAATAEALKQISFSSEEPSRSVES